METPDLPRLGDLVRRHRTAAALSQEELAERAGLSVRAISDLERGIRQMPRLETVRMLADALALGDVERAALLAAARPAVVPGVADTARSTRRTLPVPLTRLIGREADLAAVRAALQADEVGCSRSPDLGASAKHGWPSPWQPRWTMPSPTVRISSISPR